MSASNAPCLVGLALIAATLSNAETVTVRSGSSVHFLAGPSTGQFSRVFTTADFSNAQNGTAAFVITPNPLWLPSLGADPSAKWIGTNSNAGLGSGNTALYAVSFQISNPFSAAILSLSFAVDDSAGDGLNPGIYVNGTAICAVDIVGFSQAHT